MPDSITPAAEGQGPMGRVDYLLKRQKELLTELEGIVKELVQLANEEQRQREEAMGFGGAAKVLRFLEGKEPQTAAQIIKMTGISRGSLSQILYRTHRDLFVCETRRGYKRSKVWRLKDAK